MRGKLLLQDLECRTQLKAKKSRRVEGLFVKNTVLLDSCWRFDPQFSLATASKLQVRLAEVSLIFHEACKKNLYRKIVPSQVNVDSIYLVCLSIALTRSSSHRVLRSFICMRISSASSVESLSSRRSRVPSPRVSPIPLCFDVRSNMSSLT